MRKHIVSPGCVAGLLFLTALLLSISIEARGVPAEEQAATLLVRPHFENETPGPDPSAPVAGAAIFGGHVGPYALPDQEGEAAVPTDGANYLVSSAFGQPCGAYVAYEDFPRSVVNRARGMLFLQDSGGGIGTLVDWSLTIRGQEPVAPLGKAVSNATLAVSPMVQTVSNEAGTITFTVDTNTDRPGVIAIIWRAYVNQGTDWATINPPAFLNVGDGTITVEYDANPDSVRTAALVIEAESDRMGDDADNGPVDGSPATVLLIQGTAENILTISPQSTMVSEAGENVPIQVTNAGDGTMDWTAAVSVGEDFLTLANGSGTDDGSFTVQVAQNVGLPRTGVVLVNSAGAEGSPATLTVHQGGGKTYQPDPTQVGKPIPNPGVVTSALTVGDAVVIADVQVQLQIAHTWDEDLAVSLWSPSGREVLLFADVGGSGDDFGDEMTPLTLDDSAITAISDGAAPFVGTFRPQDPLSVFVGENALGMWTLTVRDRYKQDPSVDPPAFRFIDQIYGNDQGTVANQLENRTLNDAQIDQLLAEWYGADELQRIYEAEVLVRNALRYAPFDKRLRNVLLDIFYYRCEANTLIAKEKLVRAYKKRIDPPPPGERVIDQEIECFSQALSAYRTAADPYYELFTDGMGVKVSDVDPGFEGNPPFGYYVFVKEVPGRSLYAATFRDENDDPQPVVAAKSGGSAVLLTGYKDWALLFGILRDEADAARELALRYVTRGNVGDLETARDLINEVMLEMDVEGTVLMGIFGDISPSDLGANSGVPEAVASWQTAVTDLDGLRQFMEGNLNLLGFREDFLMLVQSFQDVRDSFDALAYWNDAQDLTMPLGAAVTKLQEARDSYDAYRGSQTELASQMTDQVNIYRDRLAVIVGVDPGPDPLNPSHPAYLTPAQNQGSAINLQITSIEIASNHIQQNGQEIANLKEQVEIEVQRRAQESGINANIQSIMVQYGTKQAALTKEIAEIEGLQVRAQNLADAANCVSVTFGPGKRQTKLFGVTISGGLVAYTVNAFLQQQWEEDKGDLQAQKENLSAMEQAEIKAQDDALLDVNSKANIKTWLLGMKTLVLQSEEAQLMLNQEVARLSGLLAEKEALEARIAEVNANLLTRYYADPVHRLRYQSAMLDAQKAFEEAQKWVYFTVRAFEYKHNIPGFVSPNGYSLNSVFAARNADELVDIVTDIKAYDVLLGLPGGVAKEDWLSFTEDILGYRRLNAEGTPALYTDPFTGMPQVTATEIFRNYILTHMDDSGIVTLDFSTVRDNGTSFFYGPRFLANGTLVTPGTFLDKIDYMKINLVGQHTVPSTVAAGALTQAGVQFVRNISVGTFDPETPNHIADEMTAWSSRFWFLHPGNPMATPPVLPQWRFNEGLTANIVLNLTNTSHDASTAGTFDEFAERSVAATNWKLVIFTEDISGPRVNIDELDDIEIYFNHRAKNRPFKKAEEEKVR